MLRRSFIVGATSAVAALAASSAVRANVPVAYDWTASPPTTDRQSFIDWMVKNRGEDAAFLGERFDRFEIMVKNRDLTDDRTKRAFLMTPREEFCLKANLPRAYDNDYLDINFGVTISGPHLVGRMTQSLNIQKGEKLLEVGTGSGYQSAFLSNLTDNVHTIEIIKPLQERTDATYTSLIGKGYSEYSAITRENADGYYGWADAGPFDKIIVTCGIDHIPPSLLQQLQPNGIMVIPVGPPGAQHVLKVVKQQLADGTFNVTRSDIYNGKIVPFVPFTKLDGDKIVGTHNG
jgi:protein-L-isoaspartate(D-aspartate) O-methyltransferase